MVVAIETDRGPWVAALRAAGYQVFAINPLSSAQYRERYSTSGAKSDAGDAHVLAEIIRLDRDHHRQIAGDSNLGTDPSGTATEIGTAGVLPAAVEAFEDLSATDSLLLLARVPSPAKVGKLTRSQGCRRCGRPIDEHLAHNAAWRGFTIADRRHELDHRNHQVFNGVYRAS